jgi:hypothetical protein
MKKRFPYIVLLVIVFGFMFSLEGCHDEPNPCAALKPVSADFRFQQSFYGIDSLFNVDTILMIPDRNLYVNEKVSFNANEEHATYLWKVGNDPDVFTKKSFILNFDKPAGKVDVKLIVTKKPNSTCFPKDDGIDTVTRSLYILDASTVKHAFEGTFTGHLTKNVNDIFDITIVDLGQTPRPNDPPQYYGLKVYNLPKGCGRNDFTPKEYTPQINQATYRNFYFEGQGYANVPCGDPFTALGRVYDHNNKISISISTYHYDLNTNKTLKSDNQFIGTRKN